MARRIVVLSLLAACHSGSNINTLPAFVVQSSIVKNTYDGTTDDLLTAGLGKSGLQGASPTISSTSAPTAADLRKLAIYNNYRALVDITTSGGYGVLYGPNIDVNGNDTGGQGLIAGDEWLAYDDDGSGTENTTMMVQVPSTFDKTNPCIVTATSSGSRGVYGAIATAGEWGLKHGCAVAYSDKGTGSGVHDLQNNTVNLIDGRRQDAPTAGKNSNFTAQISDADRASFVGPNPFRFAVKHAHSQRNPEKDWGKYTLHAIEFAYHVLNDKFGTAQSNGNKVKIFNPGQILTIAASVSNGAGAALAAAEQDTQGFIKGVVAGEPEVQVSLPAGVTIKRGANNVSAAGSSLFDYMTTAALYQPCAALAASVSATAGTINALNPTLPNITTWAQNRCAVLQAKGLLSSTMASAQQDEALAKLHAAGWEADSDLLHSSHFASYATPAVAVTYANAYAKASAKDNLCNYSFSSVDASGSPAALAAPDPLAQIFGTSNGIPPTGPVSLVNNASFGGVKRDIVSQSPSASAIGQDLNTDGLVCLRNLLTGTDAPSNTLKASLSEVRRSGRLHGIPAILVQGRSDALIPVNHASRAYYALNKSVESNSSVSYFEVTNAQHFDTFLPLPQLGGLFVPLHRYVIQSLDLMYNHLKAGAAIPASQVVRTMPRGYPSGSATPNNIAPANVPPIPATPASADQINFANGTLTVPD